MMEHYTTQATDVRNLWLQGLRELALRQVRERDMAGETEKYKKPELYVAEVNRLWLQGLREIDHRQARARDMSRPEAPILRTELPRDDFVLPDKEFPSSGREAKTEPEARAFMEKNQERDHYRESSIYQADAPTFIAQNEEKESFSIEQNDLSEVQEISPGAKEIENSFDDENLRKEPPGEKMLSEEKEHHFDNRSQFNQVGEYQTGRYPFMEKNWPGETPKIKHLNEGRDHLFTDEDRHKEAPETKMRNESRQSLFDDNRQPKKVLNKEQGCLSIEQNDLSEAPIPIVRKEEKEHLFDRNHYRETWSYQMDGDPFIGPYFSSEASRISARNKQIEHPFNDDGRFTQAFNYYVREYLGGDKKRFSEASRIKGSIYKVDLFIEEKKKRRLERRRNFRRCESLRPNPRLVLRDSKIPWDARKVIVQHRKESQCRGCHHS